MKKTLLAAALAPALLGLGACTTTQNYNDIATRYQLEREVTESLKSENHRNQLYIADLEKANTEYQAALKKAMELADAQPVVVEAPVDVDSIRKELIAELSKDFAGLNSSEFNVVQAEHAVGVRLDDGADLLFRSGGWELTPKAKTSLDTLAEMIADTLNRNPEYVVRVDGHTDSDPIRNAAKAGVQDNTDLGFRRAYTVRQYLLQKGIAANRMTVLSAGEYIPLSNEKRLNRRVEIWVSTPDGFSLGTPKANGSVAK